MYTEVMTPLQVFAVTAHEIYSSFVEAGFTEVQATYLTGQRINADAR